VVVDLQAASGEFVSDEEIGAAHAYLAQHEGIFVEPASAACVAGLFKKKRAGH
jgi:threonine synthase